MFVFCISSIFDQHLILFRFSVSCTTEADKKTRLDAANSGKSARELKLYVAFVLFLLILPANMLASFRREVAPIPSVMRRAIAQTANGSESAKRSTKRSSKAKRSMKARTTY